MQSWRQNPKRLTRVFEVTQEKFPEDEDLLRNILNAMTRSRREPSRTVVNQLPENTLRFLLNELSAMSLSAASYLYEYAVEPLGYREGEDQIRISRGITANRFPSITRTRPVFTSLWLTLMREQGFDYSLVNAALTAVPEAIAAALEEENIIRLYFETDEEAVYAQAKY